jgi:lysophospholipase L1-like esterase
VTGAGISAGSCGGGSDTDTDTDANTELTVWIAGDSTVATNGSDCPTGWGAVFNDLFNDKVSTVNSAVGGRSIRTWLYNVTTQMGGDGECVIETDLNGNAVLQDRWVYMLDNMKTGDYLFIQFGINDGDSSCARHVGEDQYEIELAYMAQTAKDKGAQPVFLTPVSMIRCSGSTAVGSRGFLEATFSAGEDNNVPVIDLHQLSVDLYNDLGFCPLPNGASDVDANTGGEVGAFFCDDHTHFDNPGAAAVAEVIAEALADRGVALSAYLL